MKLIVYSDGACRGNPGEGSVGGVIKNDNNQTIEEISYIIGPSTNNIAEYKALVTALKRAQELGATEVEAIADSELLVKQIQGKYAVKSTVLRPLYLEAVVLATSFASFKIRHVLRAQNQRADYLANQAFIHKLRLDNK
ncbi:MAG: ribonuclease HI family protein [Chloroflexi bacterium]|nr:ribonuclease HI family protein [Chloroflexota bacterium]